MLSMLSAEQTKRGGGVVRWWGEVYKSQLRTRIPVALYRLWSCSNWDVRVMGWTRLDPPTGPGYPNLTNEEPAWAHNHQPGSCAHTRRSQPRNARTPLPGHPTRTTEPTALYPLIELRTLSGCCCWGLLSALWLGPQTHTKNRNLSGIHTDQLCYMETNLVYEKIIAYTPISKHHAITTSPRHIWITASD